MNDKLAPYKKQLAELAHKKERIQNKLNHLTREEERITKEMRKECSHPKVKERFDGPKAPPNALICIECGKFEWEYRGYKILGKARGREILKEDLSNQRPVKIHSGTEVRDIAG